MIRNGEINEWKLPSGLSPLVLFLRMYKFLKTLLRFVIGIFRLIYGRQSLHYTPLSILRVLYLIK